MNLGTLNTIIAVVVVLLVLSLVVQSIQTVLKKLLKLKSKQIEESLKDLFDQAIGASQRPTTPTGIGPTLKSVLGRLRGRDRAWTQEAEQFKNGILQQFKNVGRVTRWGYPVLDSLSKEDLIKVMAKLDLERFFPTYVEKLQDLANQVENLRAQIESIAKNQQISGSASAKLSELRAIVTPLISDVQALTDGKQKVKPQVVFGDLLRLTKLEVSPVLTLVSEAQTAVNAEIDKATKTSPGNVPALQQISTSLTSVATVIGDLSQRFDQAVAPLRGKVSQVETWFDTISQSFDERYTRHMRTVSICISIVVVVVLNANFFSIYNNISANEIQKNLIAEAGVKLLDDLKTQQTTPNSNTTSPKSSDAKTGPQNPLATNAESSKTREQAAGNQNPENKKQNDQASSGSGDNNGKPGDQPGGGNKPDDQSTTGGSTNTSAEAMKAEVERTRQTIQLYVNTYEQFGFQPLTLRQIESFYRSSRYLSSKCDDQPSDWGCTMKRNDKGLPLNKNNEEIPRDCVEAGKGAKCEFAWRPQLENEYWAGVRANWLTLLGWAVMVVLLSVGAPFWQDTLESLFGIKNLLRQKSETQNAEQETRTGKREIVSR